jgi:hypothetical protein
VSTATGRTADDKVIGVVDDVCPERLIAAGEPPMLEEPVHVDIGQQRARHSPNAKGNFCFDRVIALDRSRCVLDLRLKR